MERTRSIPCGTCRVNKLSSPLAAKQGVPSRKRQKGVSALPRSITAEVTINVGLFADVGIAQRPQFLQRLPIAPAFILHAIDGAVRAGSMCSRAAVDENRIGAGVVHHFEEPLDSLLDRSGFPGCSLPG